MTGECTHECESCRLAKIEANAAAALAAVTDAADALAARMDRLEEAASVLVRARDSLSGRSNTMFGRRHGLPVHPSTVDYQRLLAAWDDLQ